MEETKTFKLPVSGKTVMVKGYMTGYIDQEIQRIVLGANKAHLEREVDSDKAGDEMKAMQGQMKMVMDIDPTVKLDADKKLIELMVLAIDGNTGDIVTQVLNLPKQDVDFIKAQLKGLEDASKVQGSDPKAPNN